MCGKIQMNGYFQEATKSNGRLCWRDHLLITAILNFCLQTVNTKSTDLEIYQQLHVQAHAPPGKYTTM